jgi:DNA-binding MurR/RpiR family transcriptional regulator
MTYRCKLTAAQEAEIVASKESGAKLSKVYGVSPPTILRIRQRHGCPAFYKIHDEVRKKERERKNRSAQRAMRQKALRKQLLADIAAITWRAA